MKKIAHIIDQRTPLDMLEQLFALCREGEEIFSLGSAPDLSLTAGAIGAKILKLTNNRFPGRFKASLPDRAILHVWGEETFRTALKCKNPCSASFVLSLECLPQTSKQCDALSGWINCEDMVVTVPTQHAKNELFQNGADESKVLVLPPAAKPFDGSAADSSLNIRKIIRGKIRESLGISDSDRLVVAPAEMKRGAGHKMASWAHAIVEQLVDGCKIVFPGGGVYEQSVKFFSDTTGYPDDIFFTGNSFTIRDILWASDIAAFFYERDCGVTILAEAMLSGLTILASTTPDITSICSHEDSALLVKPNDPRAASAVLLRVMDDYDPGKRLGRNAAEFAAANFDSVKVRQRLDEIYTDIRTSENI